MKKTLLFVLLIIAIVVGAMWWKNASPAPSEKVYVALEGEGAIAVIDTATKKVVKKIDLSLPHTDGSMMTYAPHNVQVSPDQQTVWVTANVSGHMNHSAWAPVKTAYAHGGVEDEHSGEAMASMDDTVIVIDPERDIVIKRITIAPMLHLAHVALTPDSAFAYVTAQNEDVIYKIDARTFERIKKIALRKGSGPHGLRVSPDGNSGFVAMNGALGILDIATDTVAEAVLQGTGVQTGATPDGKFAVMSLYDTKKLAVYDVLSKKLSFIDLPFQAKGPIQMYPTPDSKYIYLADQGYYSNQPTGDTVYKIDLLEMKVVKEIKAGNAPHGVVVAPDGKTVFVTNLLSGDVSFIDTTTDSEVTKVSVGKEPNGVSVWQKTSVK